MKPKPQSEKEITASIRALLKAFGIFHYKNWQGLGSQKGVSDIIGIHKGHYGHSREGKFFAIEVKREDALKCPYNCNHKICEKQATFLDTVKSEGGIALVARSVDDVFEGLGIGNK